MNDAKKTSFLRWASHSLVGHVVLMQLAFSAPMFVLFLGLNYSDGTLTFVWTLYTLIVTSVAGLVLAILFWYTVSSPLIKRRKKDTSVDRK